MMKSCATCEFWLSRERTTITGVCRRYPPTPDDVGIANFPETHRDTWCGEWQPDYGKMQRQAEARAVPANEKAPDR